MYPEKDRICPDVLDMILEVSLELPSDHPDIEYLRDKVEGLLAECGFFAEFMEETSLIKQNHKILSFAKKLLDPEAKIKYLCPVFLVVERY